MLANELLRDRYIIKLANSGKAALRVAQHTPPPDLILLDVMMPEMDGHMVCASLKADPNTSDIPVIFLTANSNKEEEARGFREGAVDHIAKPFDPEILLARVATHLRLRQTINLLKEQNKSLQESVSSCHSQIAETQDNNVLMMAGMAEARDGDTYNHLRRTQQYVALLAQKLKNHPRFQDELSDENIQYLVRAAPLHDIGKVGISDDILLKPGKLTTEEFELMKLHTLYGRDVLLSVEKQLNISNRFLHYAKQIAYSHQEKFDGTGYPQGLSGDAIPIAARIMALADVYDALISQRVYKPAYCQVVAMRIIREGSGKHFDPDIVDAMFAVENQIIEVAKTYSDDSLPNQNMAAKHAEESE